VADRDINSRPTSLGSVSLSLFRKPYLPSLPSPLVPRRFFSLFLSVHFASSLVAGISISSGLGFCPSALKAVRIRSHPARHFGFGREILIVLKEEATSYKGEALPYDATGSEPCVIARVHWRGKVTAEKSLATSPYGREDGRGETEAREGDQGERV